MEKTLLIGSEGILGTEIKRILPKNSYLCLDKIFTKEDIQNGLIPFDILSEKSIDHLINILHDQSIYISGIVYLIGYKNKSNFFNSSIHDWNQTFDLNINKLFIFLKKIYSLFSSSCSIVILASQNGIVGHEDRVAYGPSKAALIQLCKNLTVDFSLYSEKDIRINSISPSYIAESNDNHYFDSYPGKKFINRIPNKKLVEAKEVAEVVKFLLSNKCKSIRGQNIIIDNGYTII